MFIQVKFISNFSFRFIYFYYLDFIEAWRKISVEGLDDSKISSFLDKEGHVGLMKDAPRHMVSLDFCFGLIVY